MARQEPMTPTTCDRCGKRFNTSSVHPRRYCSIACEEGRGPLPDSDPESPNYWLHLQGEPKALVGRHVVASGLKRTCYSPDWHRSPESYNARAIVTHDEANEVLVYQTDVYLGQVVAYENGQYKIRYDANDGSATHFRWHEASMVVSQIRRENWWID